MSTAGIAGTLIRDLATGESSSRIPEPYLVMDDPEKISVFVRTGREAGF